MRIRTKTELCEAIACGARPEFLFFWGHHPESEGLTGKSCLSQWFASSFASGEERFSTAEHYMMARKAELFGDLTVRKQILAEPDPGKAKALGRAVRGFKDKVWEAHRWDIVVQANHLKFSQAPELKYFLLGTEGLVLVEASPMDLVWGIGLSADASDARNPSRWPGLNLLGFALMEVRAQLREAASH